MAKWVRDMKAYKGNILHVTLCVDGRERLYGHSKHVRCKYCRQKDEVKKE